MGLHPQVVNPNYTSDSQVDSYVFSLLRGSNVAKDSLVLFHAQRCRAFFPCAKPPSSSLPALQHCLKRMAHKPLLSLLQLG